MERMPINHIAVLAIQTNGTKQMELNKRSWTFAFISVHQADEFVDSPVVSPVKSRSERPRARGKFKKNKLKNV